MKYSDKYVTITVAGPKGSGKTLLMRLIRSELENCRVEIIDVDNEPDILVIHPLSEQQIRNVISETGE